MPSYRNNNSNTNTSNIINNPYAAGPAKRRRTRPLQQNDLPRELYNRHHNNQDHHNAQDHRSSSSSSNNDSKDRCVLLFDMDCFYAQCERVRLGLPLDVKLCLFQWNSVLAVTYPAREHGIKRGDSWDDVATKTKANASNANAKTKTNMGNTPTNAINSSSTTTTTTNGSDPTTTNGNDCYTIHLPILGNDADVATVAENENGEKNIDDSNGNGTETENKNANANDNDAVVDDSIEASYRRIYELSKEEQLRCQRTENGLRRFHQQGKACLERYRLASMRIFAVVLESLQKRVTQQRGYSFVLERASIDEFYLDLTEYCYCRNQNKGFAEGSGDGDKNQNNDDDDDDRDKTVVAGRRKLQGHCHNGSTEDPVEIALNRACRVSYWIRHDIWKILGFTMSAGISTNKTMAKLAASYGKPNGQAVLYPNYFSNVLAETKITKVRNFGGKLGKTVLKLLFQYQQQEDTKNNNQKRNNESEADGVERLKSTATMGDLRPIPLPFLLHSSSSLLSPESARFVFSACKGIDHEKVKETSGALVKSITAFKSFTATKHHTEIFDRWLALLATEIIERVGRDTVRNKRYPKSCTLNYTYYTTSNGQRPPSTTGRINTTRSTRSQRVSRSLRLRYPPEREGTKQEKSASLLAQAKNKLIPIVKDHPLRGVGLSVSNFIESFNVVHQAPEGTASIQSFFVSSQHPGVVTTTTTFQLPSSPSPSMCTAERGITSTDVRVGVALTTDKSPNISNPVPVSSSRMPATSRLGLGFPNVVVNPANCPHNTIETFEDKDLDYARKLQASFGKYTSTFTIVDVFDG